MLRNIWIAGFAIDLWAEEKLELIVKGDEMTVECLVKFGGQAEAVARIKSVGRELAPRKNMAGNQQLRNGIASEAALIPVSSKHDGSEGGLLQAHLCKPKVFCWF